MTDWLWMLWKSLPYGAAALAVVAVGPARMMVWAGVRLETAGRSLAQAGVDYKRRRDWRAVNIRERMREYRPLAEPEESEAKA